MAPAEQGTFVVKVRRRDGRWQSLPSYAFHFGGLQPRAGVSRNVTRQQARGQADRTVERLKAANRDLDYDVDEFDSNGLPFTDPQSRE
jgi:hypothetical protein